MYDSDTFVASRASIMINRLSWTIDQNQYQITSFFCMMHLFIIAASISAIQLLSAQYYAYNCSDHDECPANEFCSINDETSGHCSDCSNCYECHDGIDGTCGDECNEAVYGETCYNGPNERTFYIIFGAIMVSCWTMSSICFCLCRYCDTRVTSISPPQVSQYELDLAAAQAQMVMDPLSIDGQSDDNWMNEENLVQQPYAESAQAGA